MGWRPQRAGVEARDLYDVLAYVRFALLPIARSERADLARPLIAQSYDAKQQVFLEFVLSHYIDQGVRELDSSKLSALIGLRYSSISDAVLDLGSAFEIKQSFTTFQQFLY